MRFVQFPVSCPQTVGPVLRDQETPLNTTYLEELHK